MWFGADLDEVRAEATRCHSPLYELSMNGTPDRESFFTAVWPDLREFPDPLGVSVLEQVIGHLEKWCPATYLCVYAD